jgi:tetratricopeptide (TPR) repeat protein
MQKPEGGIQNPLTPTPTPTPAPQAPSALQALRDKALATWREAVSQDPAAIAEALPLIWQVEPDVAGLRQLTPERLVSQEALFAFLMDQQRFAEALATLQTMERLNQTRPTIEDVKHLPLAEIYRLDRRSRAEVDRMIQEQTLIALGLMEDWPARARRLAAYQQALDEITRQSLQQLLADSRSGDLHRREMMLQSLLQRNPGALAPRVPLAEALFILGKTEEATATLMPLIYQEAPVPRSLLEPALAMLRKWAPPPPPDEFSRQAFLRLALSIRLAETAKGSTPQERAAWLADLAAMEKLALQNPHNVWIQRHLIPFYAGRVHELDGQPELAVAAYRHCLEISPNNLFAQTRLARCGKDEAQRHKGTEAQSGSQAPQAPENGSTGISLGAPSPSSASRAEQGTGLRTQDPGPSGQAKSGSPISNPQSPIPAPQAPEGGIQNLLTPTLTPTPAPQALSRYGSSLALVGISSSQAKIGRTGTVQVTQTWLCTGDVDRDYAIVTRYRQGDQILFSDRFALVALATAETPMVSWRVGELIPLTRTITPISMAARARNRLENGKIDAEVVLQPLAPGHPPPAANPPARIPLFVVGE